MVARPDRVCSEAALRVSSDAPPAFEAKRRRRYVLALVIWYGFGVSGMVLRSFWYVLAVPLELRRCVVISDARTLVVYNSRIIDPTCIFVPYRVVHTFPYLVVLLIYPCSVLS